MDLLDFFILIAALGYAFGGYRNGAVVGVFSFAGFLGGAVVGAQVGRPLATLIAHGRGQVVVALVSMLVLALVGQLALVYAARLLRSRITWRSAQAVDSGIGALLAIVSVLLVAWMVAVPLASSPYPNLASQARRSVIVAKVDAVVPNGLRQVYSSLRNFIDRSGFPQVTGPLQATHIVSVGPPNLTLGNAPGVTTDQPSVVKVLGTADKCSRSIEGSGFVYKSGYVITNAHVVAGTSSVAVQTIDATFPAKVITYDADRDVAVLSVPKLTAKPLAFAPTASPGDDAIVLGYPENGKYTPGPAKIREQERLTGPNIYGTAAPARTIYSIRGTVRSGNSGGPLITPDGQVLGIVFATALDSSDTGFVLTDDEIQPDIDAAAKTPPNARAADTSKCTP